MNKRALIQKIVVKTHERIGDLFPRRVGFARHSDIESAGDSATLTDMGKIKNPATGEGYLGEIMVHRLSRTPGVVESVAEANAGWPPQVTLKLKDGSLKKGKLSDFREPSGHERTKFSAA